MAVAPTTLTCADLGNATVTLIVTDGCNNVGTCNTTVEVIDALKPHMACKGLDIYLDDTGNPVTVDPANIDNGVTDNCGLILLELSQTTFGCDDIGENNVKLIARDLSDNSNECSATIRVYDLIAPTFSYFPPDVTVYCTEDEASEEPIATDNCGVVSTGMTDSQELVPGGPAGSYLVRRSWWAVDKAGNDVTAEQRVVVLADGQMVTLCNDDIVTAPSKVPVQAYWDAPKVDDICNGSYAMTQMEGPASGSYFNPGTRTRITYGYQDSWGTRYECAFHVEVPGIEDDYQVHIQQADADCGDLMIESCTITDVSGASLFWTPKGSGVEVEYSLQPGATLEKYANGTALLTGSWRDAGGTNGWDGTLWFHHRRSYEGWTQAGGQAHLPSADVDNWQFFEVNASGSSFTGVGNHADMQIQASPNHVGKGLQLGNGANGSPGQGGWCAIAGRNMNNVFVGRGELAFNQNCSNTNLIVDAAEVVSLNGADFPTTWSNGVTGPELGDAAPGTWSVQVTDESGQVHNHTFGLVAPTGCNLLWEDACRELNSTWDATAWQISTWQNGTADRAVDGNTDGDFGNGSVTSTLAGWQNWWSADLQGNYNIESVRIWPRTDGNNSGLDPFYVLVSADPIPDLAPEQLLTTAGIRAIRHEGPMNEAWRMPVGLIGRYVKVQLAESGRLMLAEVEALVCQDDRLDPIPGAPIWTNGPGNANGDKVANASDLAAWPNPASDELNIYIQQSRVAATSVTILSMTGQQVYRQDLPDAREHQLRIPVGQWLSGMYTVVLSGTEGIQTQWVQVQH
ncbi:MAG: HYR domain-containing protein [Saprospiraceae bacterium]